MKKIFALFAVSILFTGISARADEEWNPAKPIRSATMRGSINKEIVETIPGGVRVSSEIVCNFETDIPVFDVRGKNEYFSTEKNFTCDSTLAGKPVKIDVTGYWAFQRWVSPNPVLNGDVKTASVYLSPRSGDFVLLPNLQRNGFSATRDLGTKSLILHASAPHSGDEAKPREEMFSVTAELIDENQ